MALRVNASLARVFMVAIPVTALVLVVIMVKARPLFRKMQSCVDRVNAVVQENLTGIRVVKSFNRQEFEKKFKERNDDLRDTALKAISLVILLMPALNLDNIFHHYYCLWFGGMQVTAGTIGSSEPISFITHVTPDINVLDDDVRGPFFFMQFVVGFCLCEQDNGGLKYRVRDKRRKKPCKES